MRSRKWNFVSQWNNPSNLFLFYPSKRGWYNPLNHIQFHSSILSSALISHWFSYVTSFVETWLCFCHWFVITVKFTTAGLTFNIVVIRFAIFLVLADSILQTLSLVWEIAALNNLFYLVNLGELYVLGLIPIHDSLRSEDRLV